MLFRSNLALTFFGNEKMDALGKKRIMNIINQGYKAVPELTTNTHFNENLPEYQNVYISNMRDQYVMVYNGKKWNLEERNPVIEQIFTDKRDFLIEKYEELKSELPPHTIRKFDRFLRDQDDETVINDTKKEIQMILYNYKDLPIKTRKMLSLKDK